MTKQKQWERNRKWKNCGRGCARGNTNSGKETGYQETVVRGARGVSPRQGYRERDGICPRRPLRASGAVPSCNLVFHCFKSFEVLATITTERWMSNLRSCLMFTGNKISVNVPCSLIIPLIFEGILIFEHDLDRFFLLKTNKEVLTQNLPFLRT